MKKYFVITFDTILTLGSSTRKPKIVKKSQFQNDSLLTVFKPHAIIIIRDTENIFYRGRYKTWQKTGKILA